MANNVHKCGWCITNYHDTCKREIRYYDKVWLCECDCNKTENDNNEKQGDESEELSTQTLGNET